MLTRRFALALSAAVTAILTLSACGGDDGQAADDRKPTRAPSATPSVTASDEPGTPAEMMPLYRIAYEVNGSPMCSHVAWDDAGCGEDLTAVGKLAAAMVEKVERDFPGGEYTEVEKSAGQVVKSVNTVRKLGCYRMSSTPPKTDAAKLRELCPSLSTLASLSWLNFETTVSSA
ncbi:hypothetical protein KBZ94_17695 [Streptomyces sp. RM72]|uniref:hypothetical protein n=1 Tax=Streptomyces sp. RM72 TaxID=1115510 RepID=UPI001B3944AD|nr:hypothetical protein [Streptomyces sp. RM72]MBQ0886750.1 hypothetical protein [Streptomyces sp. RM72]